MPAHLLLLAAFASLTFVLNDLFAGCIRRIIAWHNHRGFSSKGRAEMRIGWEEREHNRQFMSIM